MEFTMSEDPAGNPKPFDPLEQFRGMRDTYLDAMAKAMVEAVNTEGYAQATGAMLDNSLTISAPFREAMEKSMLQVLQQLSLPSRQDIVALAERFINLEMRLDDMDAKLDRLEKASLSARSFAGANAAKPMNKKFVADPVTSKVSKAPRAVKRAAKTQQAPSRSARKGTR
jgi:hypothetical protein